MRTYLLHKRRHILESTPHGHLMIIPGDARRRSSRRSGRSRSTIASPRVPGSPNYRLMVRNRRFARALERFRPDLIECQDAYNLPWAAIAHRRRHPDTALIAAYMTDFPTVYLERPLSRILGTAVRRSAWAGSAMPIAECSTRRFDSVFALSENGGAAKLRSLGIEPVEVVPLGVELGEFGPERRDARLRAKLGLGRATSR